MPRAREPPYSGVADPKGAFPLQCRNSYCTCCETVLKSSPVPAPLGEGLGPQLHQLQTQKKREKKIVGRDLWRSANPNPVSKHSQLQRWMLPYPSTKRAVSHKESSIESNKFTEETGKAKAH